MAVEESIYNETISKRYIRRGRIREKLSGTTAALIMIGAAILALILTNVGLHEPLQEIMEVPLGIKIDNTFYGLTVESLVNDLLMAFFFLQVGCELKYEMTVGALAKPKNAILPMVAALGGVAGPAIIFMLMNLGGDALNGWAIPTATDIAFALAVMSLFGSRIPAGVKVFFTTLAIADDLVAILVIAIFYSSDISFMWLGIAVVVVAVLVLLNRLRVHQLAPYMIFGAVLWLCFYNSGIHATLSGVVLAFTLPVNSNISLNLFNGWLRDRGEVFAGHYRSDAKILGQNEVTRTARQVAHVARDVTPPLQRVEHAIDFPVNFIILPIFAFVNAQVYIAGSDMLAIITSNETLGVWIGLVLGKPIGILLLTFILVKFFKFSLPQGARWGHMVGVGILGGIGFTMSILVCGLAYTDEMHITEGKVGILLGTFTAAIIGLIYMFIYLRYDEKKHPHKTETPPIPGSSGGVAAVINAAEAESAAEAVSAAEALEEGDASAAEVLGAEAAMGTPPVEVEEVAEVVTPDDLGDPAR